MSLENSSDHSELSPSSVVIACGEEREPGRVLASFMIDASLRICDGGRTEAKKSAQCIRRRQVYKRSWSGMRWITGRYLASFVR